MSILLRSLLLLSFGAAFLVADLLCAQGPPPLPVPPRPDSAQLEALQATFSSSGAVNSGVTHSQSIQTVHQDVPVQDAHSQNVHFPEHLPPSRSATQQVAFMTSPIPSPPSLAISEGSFRGESSEVPYFGSFDEYEIYEIDDSYGLYHAMLDRPLGGRLPAFGDEEPQARGWRDKLATPNFAPIISVGSTLLIVIAAFFILALFLRKVTPQSARALPKEAFECLGRYYLTQKHQLQLLRMGNRILLVSVMPDGVSTLAEITDPDEAVSLLGLCRRLDTNSATEMFRKTVAGMSEDELSRPQGRPIATSQRRGLSAPALDLYSEPEESLAAILARGRRDGR